jgi:hypothetical protein
MNIAAALFDRIIKLGGATFGTWAVACVVTIVAYRAYGEALEPLELTGMAVVYGLACYSGSRLWAYRKARAGAPRQGKFVTRAVKKKSQR